ncbi:hypothetical protein BGZ72_005523 [Mortierella alpina]|nr:hypothetical protein BGZ72_005523 [Mortierella alpina]
MHTQGFRLSSSEHVTMIELRSTPDGKHYCHVNDIKSMLDFDTTAEYRVGEDLAKFLPEDNGAEGESKLIHYPSQVIEVFPCDKPTPKMSQRSILSDGSRYSLATASVAAATSEEISGHAPLTVVMPSSEGVEDSTNQSRDEPHIAMPSFIPHEERKENLDDEDKKRHVVVQDSSQREKIGGALEDKEEERAQEPQDKTQIPRDDLSWVTLVHPPSINDQVKTICTHSYELHEHPCPHLFVTLPEFKGPQRESYQLKDLSEDRFRLYFICEGGTHRRSGASGGASSDHPEDHVHLTLHEGYELLRPDEFLSKFGQYALGILQFMRESKSIGSNLANLGGSLTTAAEKKLHQDALMVEKIIKAGPAVDKVANYLQTRLDTKNTSGSFDKLDGADLRRLGTFLHKKDHERVFGNLWRVVTPGGRVKWVCKHHFDEAQRQVRQKLMQLVLANDSGSLQENLRHLTLSFKTYKTAVMILEALAGVASISELSMTLDWSFRAHELESIVTRFNQSSVQLLTLDLKDKGGFFKRPRAKGKLLASHKYQSLLMLYQNPRLRSFRLFGASRFGTRSEPLVGNIVPNLQTLHFRIRFDCKEDQLLLQSIVQRCPQLVDLQLGGTYKAEIHDALAEAIGGLKKLEVFHLYGMEKSGEGLIICNLLKRLQDSGCPLRELVLVNSQLDAVETMGLIKSCEKTLEVLVLDLAVFQPLKLTSIFPTHCGCSMDDYQLLRNLTSLHFHVADELRSVEQLAKTLKGLSLTHLGLSQRDPLGVKKSLDGKSLLHYVNFGSLRSLFLSGFSGSCLSPLWESAMASGSFAAAHRPLKSLSLEFLSNCPDLAKKLNRLALESLWVVAEVRELGCEINRLALDLDLSTLKNVALFRAKYPASWYASSLTEGSVKTYFEKLEKHLKSGKAQDLTMRVGDMIGENDQTDLNGLSGLLYNVDGQRHIEQGENFVWKHHNPRYHRYRWGHSFKDV